MLIFSIHYDVCGFKQSFHLAFQHVNIKTVPGMKNE